MTNMSLNSNFDKLSNEVLYVQIFHVVLKLLLGASEPPGTNVTKIGQGVEG